MCRPKKVDFLKKRVYPSFAPPITFFFFLYLFILIKHVIIRDRRELTCLASFEYYSKLFVGLNINNTKAYMYSLMVDLLHKNYQFVTNTNKDQFLNKIN